MWRSLAGGIVSVVAFSLTAPATKLAVASFSPFAVTGMRGLIAGIFCLAYLAWKRGGVPDRKTLGSLFMVGAVGAAGFSVLLALGLQTVPATHASVFLAMLPLLTAMMSQWMLRESTSPLFWFGAVGGAVISMGFMIARSHGHLAIGDVYLFTAVLAAAWGYVRVAKYTRVMGGARTMSWLVVSCSPIFLALLFYGRPDWSQPISTESVVALLYLGTISQSLGMFLWCWSLSTGYAALVSQTQMIQPFLSLFAAAFLLGEKLEPEIAWVLTAVMACVAISTWAKVRRPKVSYAADAAFLKRA